MKAFWIYIFFLHSFRLLSITLSDELFTEENRWTLHRLANSLKYNETCSWKNEKLRLVSLKKQITIKDPQTSIQNDRNFAWRVLRENIPFCSKNDDLVCDRLTERCRCGNRFRELFPRSSTDIPDFVLEADPNGQQRCRWAERSYCFDRIYTSDTDTICQAGSVCTKVQTGSPCSLRTFLINSPDLSRRRLYRDIFLGRHCTCTHQQEPASPTSLID